MSTKTVINCGDVKYELTLGQIKRMLYAVEHLALSETNKQYVKAKKMAIKCLTEQGRAPVIIPVGAIVEAVA